MKTAAIFLHGLSYIDTPQPVKTVLYADEKNLIGALKKLQLGYCEGDRPVIKKYSKSINKKVRVIIDCYSDSDFHYAAHLGFKIKASKNLPIENI